MSAANNERKRKTDEEEEEKRKARRLAFEQCVKEAEGMSEAMSENVRQLLKRSFKELMHLNVVDMKPFMEPFIETYEREMERLLRASEADQRR